MLPPFLGFSISSKRNRQRRQFAVKLAVGMECIPVKQDGALEGPRLVHLTGSLT